jgi:hypothetical protein
MIRDADFSPCGTWRYTLTRSWLFGEGLMLGVLLNPSKANLVWDDPTTTQMVRRAIRANFKHYMTVNCFALVDTDPDGLRKHPNPIGDKNDEVIAKAAAMADHIVLAFGNGAAYLDRAKRVLQILKPYELWCFGKTKQGYPRFPRALLKTTKERRFTKEDIKWITG